jgi:hypothetical protein
MRKVVAWVIATCWVVGRPRHALPDAAGSHCLGAVGIAENIRQRPRNAQGGHALYLSTPNHPFPLHGRGGFRTCDLSRVKRALSH